MKLQGWVVALEYPSFVVRVPFTRKGATHLGSFNWGTTGDKRQQGCQQNGCGDVDELIISHLFMFVNSI